MVAGIEEVGIVRPASSVICNLFSVGSELKVSVSYLKEISVASLYWHRISYFYSFTLGQTVDDKHLDSAGLNGH